jgi:hypothetical protein
MKKIASTFLLLSVIAMPTFALANNGKGNDKKEEKQEVKVQIKAEKKDDKKEDKKEEKKENKMDKSCFRAWGHLIAPGWIKWNSQVNTELGCFMPFGIAKKFGGNTGTTTPDTIAPVISNLFVNPSKVDAHVRWDTNENADSLVYVSTSSPVLTSSTSVSNGSLVKSHNLLVTGLNANTTYFAYVVSKDKSGNTATSSTVSFTTLSLPVDTQAPVISTILATVATTSIKVGWHTDEPATTKVYYSSGAGVNLLASTTPFVLNSEFITNHVITLSGLSTSTNYHLMLESKDSSGNTQRSDAFSATTTSGI